MNQERKLSFGVIGAGSIGKIHMMNLKEYAREVELEGVSDASPSFAEQAAKEYGVSKVYKTHIEMLENDEIDAVIVAVPNKYHAPIAIEAMKAGKHVILEKPMAINIEAAKEIVRAQKETQRIVMIPHQMRWQWLSEQIKQQAENGALGNIYYARAGWMRRKGIPGWGSAFTRKEESGGGALIDIGVHMLDLALYLMGNPKPVSVVGSTFSELGTRKKGLGPWGTPNRNGYFDVEDLATALIRMEDGSTLLLEASWAMNGEIEESGPYVHLFGTEGGAYMNEKRGAFFTERFDSPITVNLEPPVDYVDCRSRLLGYFIDCLREQKECASNVMTGFTNNLILDAIYRSSQEKREILLDWNV